MKKALIALLVLAAIAGGAVLWAWHSLDVIVKYAIEHFAPDIAGVPVTVREVRLSTSDGRGRLRGVEIGNPPGFTSPRAARVGEIAVSLDPDTVTQPLVVIREIAIEAPEITFERGARLTNLEVIQKNIEVAVNRSGGSSSPGGPTGRSRRYVIEKFTIRGARVTMTNAQLKGQGINFTMPDIQLANIGRPGEGVTASQAANVVVGALIQRIAQRVLTSLELLRKGGKEGAIDALRGILQ